MTPRCPTTRRTLGRTAVVLLLMAAVACADEASSGTTHAPPSGLFDVDGRDMFIECKGAGSPTVLIHGGLGQKSNDWAGVVAQLAPTTRTCRFDRSGIGRSERIPGDAELSVGDRADELRALLDAAQVDGPYVLVGFSYGGMLIRAFADRFGAETAGLVFIDGSHEEQFVPGGWWSQVMPPWTEGGHGVDLERSRNELLAATELGDRPTIVLTQGSMTGNLERNWSPLQDVIAAMSSNSLHMVATESGHFIGSDRPELVVGSIVAVVEAVRGTALPECAPHFEVLGAECLDSTMGDLLAKWDALRAEVEPAAGNLPPGAYSFEEDGVTITMTIGSGHLDVTMDHPGGLVERFAAEYEAVGDEVTFLWPFDWRLPRTPGVNTARWTVAPDGTLEFVQLDSEPTESWIAHPWVPVTSA